MMKLVLVLLLMASVLISCTALFQPLDCSAIHSRDNKSPSGLYTIYPIRLSSDVQVHCDMESAGGGWTVFQRRVDGTLNFYRPWDQYRSGFGNAAGEYWLGLENIHQITRYGNHELLVNMEDFEGNKAFARYSSFLVEAEHDGYTLHVSGFTDGGAGDSLTGHNRMKFSTFDKDQDTSSGNCAIAFQGAFWYKECHTANPNGAYLWGADAKSQFAVGVVWRSWKGYEYSLKTISMMIRPVQQTGVI